MRKTRKYLNLDDRKLLDKLLKEHKPMREIAQILNVHNTTLYYELQKNGGPDFYDPFQANKKGPPARLKEFTEDEIILIEQWTKEGKTIKYIRENLKCGAIRVVRYLNKENLSAPIAQNSCTITKRLDAIEEQIKLLWEMIEK